MGYVWGGVKIFSRGLGLLLLGQGVELVPQDSRKWIIYANHYSGLAFIMLKHQPFPHGKTDHMGPQRPQTDR